MAVVEESILGGETHVFFVLHSLLRMTPCSFKAQLRAGANYSVFLEHFLHFCCHCYKKAYIRSMRVISVGIFLPDGKTVLIRLCDLFVSPVQFLENTIFV